MNGAGKIKCDGQCAEALQDAEASLVALVDKILEAVRSSVAAALDEALFRRSGLVLDMDDAAPKAAGLELADVAIEPAP